MTAYRGRKKKKKKKDRPTGILETTSQPFHTNYQQSSRPLLSDPLPDAQNEETQSRALLFRIRCKPVRRRGKGAGWEVYGWTTTTLDDTHRQESKWRRRMLTGPVSMMHGSFSRSRLALIIFLEVPDGVGLCLPPRRESGSRSTIHVREWEAGRAVSWPAICGLGRKEVNPSHFTVFVVPFHSCIGAHLSMRRCLRKMPGSVEN